MPVLKFSVVLRTVRDLSLSLRIEATHTGVESTINALMGRRRSGLSTPSRNPQNLAASTQAPAASRQTAPERPASPAEPGAQPAKQRQQRERPRQEVEGKNRELEAEKKRKLEAYYQSIKDFHERALQLGYGDLGNYRWYHTIDLGNGLVTPGLYDHRPNLPAFGFPPNMEGMNVLDVGSATGFFAFEFEKRGANVVSVELPFGTPADRFPNESTEETEKRVEREYRRLEKQATSAAADSAEQRLNVLQAGSPEERYHFHNDGPFKFCHKALGSKIQRCYSSIYDLSEERLGRDDFDLVFLGDILIHAIDPLRALAAVTRLCRGTLIISQDIPEGPYPVMAYIGGDKAGEDKSSWWKPNRLCFEQILKKLGFEEVAAVGEHAGFVRPDMAPYKRSVIHAIK